MKRLLKAVALGLTCLVALAGCVSGTPASSPKPADAPAPKVTITYWTPLTGGDGEFMKAMVEEFNSKQDRVTVELNTSVWENYYTKLTAALGAGEAPDVAIVHTTHIPSFATAGGLTVIDELINKAGLKADDFVENAWKGAVYQGKRYAVPLDVHPLVWYVNLDLLEQAGYVKDGKAVLPTNMAGHKKMLADIKAKTGKFPIAMQSAGATSYREFVGLVHQNGGKLLSDDGTKAAFNSPEALEVLEYQISLISDKFTPPGLDGGGQRTQWLAGDILIMPNGVWAVGDYTTNQKAKWAALPYPTIFKKDGVWTNSHTLALPMQKNANPAKQEAALIFIKWLSDNSVMWSMAGHASVRKSVVASAEFKALAHQSVYSAKLDHVIYPPTSTKILEIEPTIIEQLQAAYAGKVSARDALKNAETKVNEILSKR
jgi:multiple sugar transport system substrate-binding protein